jgi:hypothetical protein
VTLIVLRVLRVLADREKMEHGIMKMEIQGLLKKILALRIMLMRLCMTCIVHKDNIIVEQVEIILSEIELIQIVLEGRFEHRAEWR